MREGDESKYDSGVGCIIDGRKAGVQERGKGLALSRSIVNVA